MKWEDSPMDKKADKAGTSKAPAASVPGLESDEQRVSYGIGYNMGANMARQGGFKPDLAALKMGLEDGLGGAKTRCNEADIEAAFATMQQKMAAAAAEDSAKQLAISILASQACRRCTLAAPPQFQPSSLSAALCEMPFALPVFQLCADRPARNRDQIQHRVLPSRFERVHARYYLR